MFRVEKNKPDASQLCVAPVDSSDNLSSIGTLLSLVGSCSGPGAGIHMVRNACGGHVTMTSDSGRLLASLSLSRQILKLIVSSVQGHLREYGDGGKFLAFACLNLIKSTVQLPGEFTNRRAFCALNEQFVKIISNILNSEDCAVCVSADLTDVHVLLAYTRSILSTRPLLSLIEDDCNKISELIVKCFVESIPRQEQYRDNWPSQSSDSIFIVGSLSEHPRDSRLLKGLLLEHVELPCMKGKVPLNIMTSNVEGKDSERSGNSLNRCIKVVLVTCSMSGDLEDIVSATYEVTSEQATSVECLALDKWTNFCKRLAKYQVGLLLCQRVIHPRLKILLKSLNVTALDRLGSAIIPYIRDLTGAQPVMSVIAETNPENLAGYISAAQHVILNDKSYLHLEQPTSSLVTLILCSRTEESLEEFKCCVNTCLKGLHSLLKEGKLLAGGGCWQIHCSHQLDKEVRKCVRSLADEVGCSEAQVLSALSLFRSSVFHSWVQQLIKGHRGRGECWETLAVDPVIQHCWRTFFDPSETDNEQLLCCCGLRRYVSASTLHNSGSKLHPLTTLNPSQDLDVSDSFVNHENNEGRSQSCDESSRDASEGPDGLQVFFDHPVNLNTTLDHFSANVQSLYKAVFTANLVLSLGQIISDGN